MPREKSWWQRNFFTTFLIAVSWIALLKGCGCTGNIVKRKGLNKVVINIKLSWFESKSKYLLKSVPRIKYRTTRNFQQIGRPYLKYLTSIKTYQHFCITHLQLPLEQGFTFWRTETTVLKACINSASKIA